ncbi:hypothetical protein NXS19_004428 [Fusarium pseudograminearum]|nr:hypothetical protein NXS19_004428 [Fusarium pseudograminearum]
MAERVMDNATWAFIIDHVAEKKTATTGGRPDLTIFYVPDDKNLTNWNPIFTFEGKAPKHETDMVNKGLEQAFGYLPTLAWSKRRKGMKYGMLACGKSFMILKYDAEKDELFRIDPSDQQDKSDFTTSSLDTQARGFDRFCEDFANSFL